MIKNIEIGMRVKQIRLAYGFSQNEFATEIGKTRGYIVSAQYSGVYDASHRNEIMGQTRVS